MRGRGAPQTALLAWAVSVFLASASADLHYASPLPELPPALVSASGAAEVASHQAYSFYPKANRETTIHVGKASSLYISLYLFPLIEVRGEPAAFPVSASLRRADAGPEAPPVARCEGGLPCRLAADIQPSIAYTLRINGHTGHAVAAALGIDLSLGRKMKAFVGSDSLPPHHEPLRAPYARTHSAQAPAQAGSRRSVGTWPLSIAASEGLSQVQIDMYFEPRAGAIFDCELRAHDGRAVARVKGAQESKTLIPVIWAGAPVRPAATRSPNAVAIAVQSTSSGAGRVTLIATTTPGDYVLEIGVTRGPSSSSNGGDGLRSKPISAEFRLVIAESGAKEASRSAAQDAALCDADPIPANLGGFGSFIDKRDGAQKSLLFHERVLLSPAAPVQDAVFTITNRAGGALVRASATHEQIPLAVAVFRADGRKIKNLEGGRSEIFGRLTESGEYTVRVSLSQGLVFSGPGPRCVAAMVTLFVSSDEINQENKNKKCPPLPLPPQEPTPVPRVLPPRRVFATSGQGTLRVGAKSHRVLSIAAADASLLRVDVRTLSTWTHLASVTVELQQEGRPSTNQRILRVSTRPAGPGARALMAALQPGNYTLKISAPPATLLPAVPSECAASGNTLAYQFSIALLRASAMVGGPHACLAAPYQRHAHLSHMAPNRVAIALGGLGAGSATLPLEYVDGDHIFVRAEPSPLHGADTVQLSIVTQDGSGGDSETPVAESTIAESEVGVGWISAQISRRPSQKIALRIAYVSASETPPPCAVVTVTLGFGPFVSTTTTNHQGQTEHRKCAQRAPPLLMPTRPTGSAEIALRTTGLSTRRGRHGPAEHCRENKNSAVVWARSFTVSVPMGRFRASMRNAVASLDLRLVRVEASTGRSQGISRHDSLVLVRAGVAVASGARKRTVRALGLAPGDYIIQIIAVVPRDSKMMSLLRNVGIDVWMGQTEAQYLPPPPPARCMAAPPPAQPEPQIDLRISTNAREETLEVGKTYRFRVLLPDKTAEFGENGLSKWELRTIVSPQLPQGTRQDHAVAVAQALSRMGEDTAIRPVTRAANSAVWVLREGGAYVWHVRVTAQKREGAVPRSHSQFLERIAQGHCPPIADARISLSPHHPHGDCPQSADEQPLPGALGPGESADAVLIFQGADRPTTYAMDIGVGPGGGVFAFEATCDMEVGAIEAILTGPHSEEDPFISRRATLMQGCAIALTPTVLTPGEYKLTISAPISAKSRVRAPCSAHRVHVDLWPVPREPLAPMPRPAACAGAVDIPSRAYGEVGPMAAFGGVQDPSDGSLRLMLPLAAAPGGVATTQVSARVPCLIWAQVGMVDTASGELAAPTLLLSSPNGLVVATSDRTAPGARQDERIIRFIAPSAHLLPYSLQVESQRALCGFPFYLVVEPLKSLRDQQSACENRRLNAGDVDPLPTEFALREGEATQHAALHVAAGAEISPDKPHRIRIVPPGRGRALLRVALSFNRLLSDVDLRLVSRDAGEGQDDVLIAHASVAPALDPWRASEPTHTLHLVAWVPAGAKYALDLASTPALARAPGSSAGWAFGLRGRSSALGAAERNPGLLFPDPCLEFRLEIEGLTENGRESPSRVRLVGIEPEGAQDLDPNRDFQLKLSFSAPVTIGVASAQEGYNLAGSGAVCLIQDSVESSGSDVNGAGAANANALLLPTSLRFAAGGDGRVLTAVFHAQNLRPGASAQLRVNNDRILGSEGRVLSPRGVEPFLKRLEYTWAYGGGDSDSGVVTAAGAKPPTVRRAAPDSDSAPAGEYETTVDPSEDIKSLIDHVDSSEPKQWERSSEDALPHTPPATNASCPFIVSGKCVDEDACSKALCSGHGDCVMFATAAHCVCREGLTGAGARQCGRCESELAEYPHCGVETIGDKQAEALAFERVCGAFELPGSLNLPGLLGNRHTTSFSDWFRATGPESTMDLTLKHKMSAIRAHLIPADATIARFSLRLERADDGSRVASGTSLAKTAPPLQNETAFFVPRLEAGKYRFIVRMAPGTETAPTRTSELSCDRFHLQFAVAPSHRTSQDQRKPPVRGLKQGVIECPLRPATPRVRYGPDNRVYRWSHGAMTVPADGFVYASSPGELAATRAEPGLIYNIKIRTLNLVGRAAVLDAGLETDMLRGHMRLVVRRVRSGVAVEGEGFHASSLDIFVANTDANANYVAMPLEPGAEYELSVWQTLPLPAGTKCAFYDLGFEIRYVESRQGGISGAGFAPVEACSLATLPFSFNSPGYMGVHGDQMHIHATYRYNPNSASHVIAVRVSAPSLLRLYMPFHQTQLTIKVEIRRRGGAVVKSGDNAVNDDVTAVLSTGDYEILFDFSFQRALFEAPGELRCTPFVLEAAVVPLSAIGGVRNDEDDEGSDNEGLDGREGNFQGGTKGQKTVQSKRQLQCGGLSERLPRIPRSPKVPFASASGGGQPWVVMGKFGRKYQFQVPTAARASSSGASAGARLDVVLDSDFIAGQVVLVVMQNGQVVASGEQTAANRMSLSRILTPGSYALLLRPVYVDHRRDCILFDFSFKLSPVDPSPSDAETDACTGGEAFPGGFDGVRYLRGSGLTHSFHTAARVHIHGTHVAPFWLEKESYLRVAAEPTETHPNTPVFNLSLVHYACGHGGAKGGSPRESGDVERHEKDSAFPYSRAASTPGKAPCASGSLVWSDVRKAFSHAAKLPRGQYALVATAAMCSHTRVEIEVQPVDRFDQHFARRECPMNGADALPPSPPTHVSRSWHYDSAARRDPNYYQQLEGRKLHFAARFVSEKPFRLLVEARFDFISGDLRLELDRERVNDGVAEAAPERVAVARAMRSARRIALGVLPPGAYALHLREPEGEKFGRHCSEFEFRLEIDLLDPQRAHTGAAWLLDPALQEGLPAHPPLPVSLNMAGCLVPNGECELHGVYSVTHVAWNRNLPSHGWNENSIVFNVHQNSLFRAHASPHALGAVGTRVSFRLRLVKLGEGGAQDRDLESETEKKKQSVSGLDDWVAAILPAGRYALVVDAVYPGQATAWHSWRRHIACVLTVAVRKITGSDTWSTPPPDQKCSATSTCPRVIRAPKDLRLRPGGVWKFDKPTAPACQASGNSALPLTVSSVSRGTRVAAQFQLEIPPEEAKGVSVIAEATFDFAHQHMAISISGRVAGPNGGRATNAMQRSVKFRGVAQRASSYVDLDLTPGIYNLTLFEMSPLSWGGAVGGGEDSDGRFYDCSSRDFSLLVYLKSNSPAPRMGSAAGTDNGRDSQEAWERPLVVASEDADAAQEADAAACRLALQIPQALHPLPRAMRRPAPGAAKTGTESSASMLAWGGPTWTRVRLSGFNHLRTGTQMAAAVKDLGITGEGEAVLVRLQTSEKVIIRTTAATNTVGEQLKYGLLSSNGRLQMPIVHLPTDLDNPAIFSVDPSVSMTGKQLQMSPALEDAVQRDPAERENDQRDQHREQETVLRDYFLVLNPTTSVSTQGEDRDDGCPKFNFDLAVAPIKSLQEWILRQSECDVELPPPLAVQADGRAEQVHKGRVEAKTPPIRIPFHVTVESRVTVSVAHNYVNSFFVLTLMEAVAGDEPRIVARSRPNKLIETDAELSRQAQQPDHPLLFLFDVEARLEVTVEPGDYEILVTEHALDAYATAMGGADGGRLCAGYHLQVNIAPSTMAVDSATAAVVPVATFSPTAQEVFDSIQRDSEAAAAATHKRTRAPTIWSRLTRRRRRGRPRRAVPPPAPAVGTPPSAALCRHESCGCRRSATGACEPIGSCSVHTYESAGVKERSVLCKCPRNYAGSTCQRCAVGFVGYPDCEAQDGRGTMLDEDEFGPKDLLETRHPDAKEAGVVDEEVTPAVKLILIYSVAVLTVLAVLATMLTHVKRSSGVERLAMREVTSGGDVYRYRDDGL